MKPSLIDFRIASFRCLPRLGTALSVQPNHQPALRLRRPIAVHADRVRQAAGRGSRQMPLLFGRKKPELSASDRPATLRAPTQKVVLCACERFGDR